MTQRKRGNNTEEKLSSQVEDKVENGSENEGQAIYQPYEGNFENMISTGSTLLDLAISGGRVRGGGLPGGILVEIFGPSGSGKSVMLSELGGAIQRQKGSSMFFDPEYRLNKQFAQIFGLDTEEIAYEIPTTVKEMFVKIFHWEPEDKNKIHGIFADSLAALSTELEMENDEGDKMGMKRAKEFSEWLRKTCQMLPTKNILMVASNQVRQSGNQFGPKYRTPGGESVGFYSSVRLQIHNPEKIYETHHIAGKKTTRVIGVESKVEVYKNSTWKPYRTAPLTILFDYGIDDVRQNLQFVKDYTKNNTYTVNDKTLDNSMEKAIQKVEKQNLENELREQVIDLWGEIESKFEQNRKPKKR